MVMFGFEVSYPKWNGVWAISMQVVLWNPPIPKDPVPVRTSNNEARSLPSTAPSVPWLTAAAKSLTTTGVQVSLDSNKAAGTGEDLGMEKGF